MTTATIHSRTGSQSYTVSLHDNGAASCTCKAGQYGRCCWHVNAVRAEAVVAPAYRLASMRTGKSLGMYRDPDCCHRRAGRQPCRRWHGVAWTPSARRRFSSE